MKRNFTAAEQDFTLQPRLFSDVIVAGAKIKSRRLRLRIKQEELAKSAGISLGLLSEIENGIAPNGQYVLFVEQAIKKSAVSVAMDALTVLKELVA